MLAKTDKKKKKKKSTVCTPLVALLITRHLFYVSEVFFPSPRDSFPGVQSSPLQNYSLLGECLPPVCTWLNFLFYPQRSYMFSCVHFPTPCTVAYLQHKLKINMFVCMFNSYITGGSFRGQKCVMGGGQMGQEK